MIIVPSEIIKAVKQSISLDFLTKLDNGDMFQLRRKESLEEQSFRAYST